MLSSCLKCKKNTQSNDPVVSKTSYRKTAILSKSAICDAKKSNLLKNKKQKGYYKIWILEHL